MYDPRIAPPPATPPVIARRRGPRGPNAAAIAKLWEDCGHDRVKLRKKLEARLRRAGLIRKRSDGP
jgi:hypothetical protein